MYHMELAKPDADIIVAVVNQGIDAYLQSVTDSEFTVKGNRLVCDVAPNDLGVIVRRLLETGGDAEWSLAFDIASTLGIEEILLCVNDMFYITLDEGYFENKDDFEKLASILDLPYISVFDDKFWPRLLGEDLIIQTVK